MQRIHVTDGDDAIGASHARLGMHLGDTATTDDDVVQGLAWRNKAPAKDMAGNDREADGGNSGFLQERTTG